METISNIIYALMIFVLVAGFIIAGISNIKGD